MNESLCFSRDFVSISWMHGVCFRVSKVVADPDNFLKQSRFSKMGKVRENILLFRTSLNYILLNRQLCSFLEIKSIIRNVLLKSYSSLKKKKKRFGF